MNNSEIRQQARSVLKGNWVNASLTLFLYGVLSSIGFIIALVAGGMFSALTSMGDLSRISSGSENLSPEDQMAVLSFYGKFMGAYAVGYILLFVGIGLFTLGLYKIFLGVARGEGANIGDLFKSCKYIFKVITEFNPNSTYDFDNLDTLLNIKLNIVINEIKTICDIIESLDINELYKKYKMPIKNNTQLLLKRNVIFLFFDIIKRDIHHQIANLQSAYYIEYKLRILYNYDITLYL
jgi:hypothetical protein